MTTLIEKNVSELPVRSPKPIWKSLFISTRPMHWVKNIFVFLPVVFDYHLFSSEVFSSMVVFVAFSLAASMAYMINDVLDRPHDIHHPSKMDRPITRGDIPPRLAVISAVTLGLLSILVGFTIHLRVALVLVAYISLFAAYSVWLKRIIILDVATIGVGFVLRVVAGAYAVNYIVSDWILISTFFLASLIGFSKRRYEIMYDDEGIQFNRGYSPYFLDLLILFSAATVMGSYIFYVISRGTWQNGIPVLVSVLVVFYGILRYLLLIHRSEERLDHTQLILTDRPLVAAVLVWIVLLLTELYMFNPRITWPIEQ